MAFFGLRIPLVLVAESPFLGCGIVFFWLRNRFFLVAEAPFLGCGSVSDFGCGIAEIWLRKRRNMVSESEFIQRKNWTGNTKVALTCEDTMFCAVRNKLRIRE